MLGASSKLYEGRLRAKQLASFHFITVGVSMAMKGCGTGGEVMSYKSIYQSVIKKDFEEWLANGLCTNAQKINKELGQEYFDTSNPHYFTGDVEAAVVLVHLNPKRNKPDFYKKSQFESFSEYWDFYENFGQNHYGEKSERSHKSPFDHKQIRFLRPFNVFDFSECDSYLNLQKVIDEKLQLELIPYGSPSFDFKKIDNDLLKLSIENTLRLIASLPRKYVIFCGKVFQSSSILDPYKKSSEKFEFKLRKKDGSETKNKYEFIFITLEIDNQTIHAGIAPQFAVQGAPISSYGEKIANLYDLRLFTC